MTKIIYTDSYNKKAAKFIKKHPELINQYEKTLQLLELNPNHPSLKLHKLKGGLSELYAISINVNYRISMVIFMEKNAVVPVNIGSHEDVYF